MADVTIEPVAEEQKAILGRLMQLYLHDYSEYDGRETDDEGRYTYEFFEEQWSESRIRFPYFIRSDGKLAGFALARIGMNGRRQLAEFFILRRLRREGVGTKAARLVFDAHPGDWDVTEHPLNTPSHAFWRNVINDYTNGEWRDKTNAIIAWQQFRNGPPTELKW